MRVLILAVSLLALAAAPLHANDPGPALAKAREEINAGHHAAALQLLREATAHAAALTDAKQRVAALSAVHFYSAVAASGLGDPEQATAELHSFFLYNPASKLDTSRFPRDFATLFATVQKKVAQGRNSPASFDDAYPGYPPAVSSSTWPMNIWGASSEFMILGTEAEKEQWGRLSDDAARRAFIDKFWADRDPDPSTGVNEARIELLRRIAFADVAFAEDQDERGSLSDRGRVFVLLGPPKRVRIRPMTRRESIGGTPSRTIDAGNAVEHWVYFREQLPKKLPHNEVEFKFISQGGSPVRVRQHEFISEKVVRDSPGALRRD